MWASGQSWIIYNSRPKQLQHAQNILWLQWMLITVGGIIYTILCPKKSSDFHSIVIVDCSIFQGSVRTFNHKVFLKSATDLLLIQIIMNEKQNAAHVNNNLFKIFIFSVTWWATCQNILATIWAIQTNRFLHADIAWPSFTTLFKDGDIVKAARKMLLPRVEKVSLYQMAKGTCLWRYIYIWIMKAFFYILFYLSIYLFIDVHILKIKWYC